MVGKAFGQSEKKELLSDFRRNIMRESGNWVCATMRQAMMATSKLFHLLLVVLLSLLGGAFILLFVLEGTLWISAEVVALLAFFVLFPAGFCLNLFIRPRWKPKRATRLELLTMIILAVEVILVGLTSFLEAFCTPAGLYPTLWLQIPMWTLPALAIVLTSLWSGSVFGLHREDEKVKFRSLPYKLEMFISVGFLGLTTVLFLNWLQSTKDYPLSFDGSSDQLKQTVMVPTLDTPVPTGKSAIWCASFQMAWNKFKAEVAKSPVQIKGELVAERLNHAEQSEDDLEPSSFYAAAGWVRDGFVEKIQADMTRLFPSGS